MTQDDLTNAFELGLVGFVLGLIALPFVLVWMAWRRVTRNEY